MNLLKTLILEKEQEGKCFVCYQKLENYDLFCDYEDKKAYFCCNNCKIEWIMKNTDFSGKKW